MKKYSNFGDSIYYRPRKRRSRGIIIGWWIIGFIVVLNLFLFAWRQSDKREAEAFKNYDPQEVAREICNEGWCSH